MRRLWRLRGRQAPKLHRVMQSTMTQRSNKRTKKKISARNTAFSIDTSQSGRPQKELARHQGIRASQNRANRVPTALARSELATSPFISKAKLVVNPHEGHG